MLDVLQGFPAGGAFRAVHQCREADIEPILCLKFLIGPPLVGGDTDPVLECADLLNAGLGALDGEFTVPVTGQQGSDSFSFGQDAIPIREKARNIMGHAVADREARKTSGGVGGDELGAGRSSRIHAIRR